MPRNVARTITRPCVWSRRPRAFPTLQRRYSDLELPQQKEPSNEQQKLIQSDKATHALRVADQISLRKTKATLDEYQASISRLVSTVETIPTRIHSSNPSIKGAYTIAPLRSKYPETTSELVEEAFAKIETVRQHLTDLQVEEYKDAVDIDAAFERESRGWTREEKEEKVQQWRNQENGDLARVNQSAERLIGFVTSMQRPGSERLAKSTFTGDARREEKPRATSNEASGGPAAASNVSPSLADLQKQLEASVVKPQAK